MTRSDVFVAGLRRFAPVSAGQPILDEPRMNRQALAELRRGLGTFHDHTALYRYVIPFMPEQSLGSDTLETYLLIAALFALHPAPFVTPSWENLGGTWWRLLPHEATPEDQNTRDRLEKRFIALLRTSRTLLPQHLRTMTIFLKQADIPINWSVLLDDVLDWEYPEKKKRVLENWARSFWRVSKTNDTVLLEMTPDNNIVIDEETQAE